MHASVVADRGAPRKEKKESKWCLPVVLFGNQRLPTELSLKPARLKTNPKLLLSSSSSKRQNSTSCGRFEPLVHYKKVCKQEYSHQISATLPNHLGAKATELEEVRHFYGTMIQSHGVANDRRRDDDIGYSGSRHLGRSQLNSSGCIIHEMASWRTAHKCYSESAWWHGIQRRKHCSFIVCTRRTQNKASSWSCAKACDQNQSLARLLSTGGLANLRREADNLPQILAIQSLSLPALRTKTPYSFSKIS